jgi:hypothetical protein
VKIEIEIDLTREADTNTSESMFNEMNGWRMSAMQMCPDHKIAIVFLHEGADVDPLATPCMLATMRDFVKGFREQIATSIERLLKERGVDNAEGEAPLDSDA